MFSRRIIGDCERLSPDQRKYYGCPSLKVLPQRQNISQIPKRFAHSRVGRLSVVLDLDETLVHTFQENEEPEGFFDDPPEGHYQIDLDTYYVNGMKRPYLDEFLSRLFKIAYPVIVWTAGQSRYAKEICEQVFVNDWPSKIYTYDDCEIDDKEYVKKPLRKILADFPHMVNRERLAVIDDRRSAYFSHDRSNLMIIDKWNGIGKDSSLIQAVEYLEAIHSNPGDLREEIKRVDWISKWEDR